MEAHISLLKERLVKAELEQSSLSRPEVTNSMALEMVEARKQSLAAEIRQTVDELEVKNRELEKHILERIPY